METRAFRTDLNCGSCVSQAEPYLNGEKSIVKWHVDVNDSKKILTVTGPKIDSTTVKNAVEKSGFHVFEELAPSGALAGGVMASQKTEVRSALQVYYPLILIFTFLVGVTALVQIKAGEWDLRSAMNSFMGGFFLVFSFFKLLNWSGFANAYRTYDIVAKKLPVYGYIYPIIELGLGASYLLGTAPFLTNLTTVIVMGVSTIGVAQSLLEKRAIECACLGTVFNLPMSKITLFEDLLMLGMAASMLV